MKGGNVKTTVKKKLQTDKDAPSCTCTFSVSTPRHISVTVSKIWNKRKNNSNNKLQADKDAVKH